LRKSIDRANQFLNEMNKIEKELKVKLFNENSLKYQPAPINKSSLGRISYGFLNQTNQKLKKKLNHLKI
jgi:hypothetical protein